MMCTANILIFLALLFVCVAAVSLVFISGGGGVGGGVGGGGSGTTSVKDGAYVESIKTLYRQCARWASASIQDQSDIIKTLHANYATGYLWALKDIVTTDDFKKITGQDFLEFEKVIVKVQDAATKSLITKCKDLVFTDDPILIRAMYSR